MNKLKYIVVILGLIFSLSVQAEEEELLENEVGFLVSANDCDIPTLKKHIADDVQLNVLTWNDKFGMTALMLANLADCHVGFDMLINAGADVNVQVYENGYTVLMRAILNGNLITAKKLINHPDIDFTIKDIRDKTALTIAMEEFQTDVGTLLYVDSLSEYNKQTHSEYYIQTLVKLRLLALKSIEKSGKIIALLMEKGAE